MGLLFQHRSFNKARLPFCTISCSNQSQRCLLCSGPWWSNWLVSQLPCQRGRLQALKSETLSVCLPKVLLQVWVQVCESTHRFSLRDGGNCWRAWQDWSWNGGRSGARQGPLRPYKTWPTGAWIRHRYENFPENRHRRTGFQGLVSFFRLVLEFLSF